MRYYVVNCPFSDWIIQISKNTKIKCVPDLNNVPVDNSKIIPFDINNIKNFGDDERLLFKLNLNVMHILDNKCLFYNFMMKEFSDNIPKIYYINTDTIFYVDDEIGRKNKKMIKKPSKGSAGANIKIVYSINKMEKDVVITDYIQHNEFFVGHFFVLNGKIMKNVYFKSRKINNDSNFILKINICSFGVAEMTEQLRYDTSIFDRIFDKLNYTGFACSDFVIICNKIIIFEINPRPGGSLFYNKKYLCDFFDYVTNFSPES